ncbi:MAG TPA: hypothetical protein VKB93_26070 [Thermoanaerobaculia bacterium]|nr:hypothetical protein [Thermoanaerobaculia bacterium]
MKQRVLLVLVVLSVFACGKRGDPKPPVPVIPQATTDLLLTQRAGKVLLSWSYPSLTTAGKSLTDIRRITIYRYVEELPVPPAGKLADVDTTEPQPIALFSKVPTLPQAQFVKLSTKVDSIEKANLGSVTAGSRLLYTDSPPLRATDGRPVRLTYAVVTEGSTARSAPSNLAIVVPLPVGVPPAGVTAQAKAEGVTVSWSEPKQSVDAKGAPVISGYNIFRTAPGEELDDLATPINTAPVKGTMYTDTPAYGEHAYRVSAVAWTGPPLLQSDPSEAARVTYKDLVPPAAPAKITALVETNAVRLIWDEVAAPDLAGYRLYRGEATGFGETLKDLGSYDLLNRTVTGTTFTDTTMNLGISYRYAVTAIDKNGNQSPRVWTEWLVVPKTP